MTDANSQVSSGLSSYTEAGLGFGTSLTGLGVLQSNPALSVKYYFVSRVGAILPSAQLQSVLTNAFGKNSFERLKDASLVKGVAPNALGRIGVTAHPSASV